MLRQVFGFLAPERACPDRWGGRWSRRAAGIGRGGVPASETCTSAAVPAPRIPRSQHHPRFHFHQIIAAPVGHAELQAGAGLIGRHHHLPAEGQARRGSRESSEQQAGANGQRHQSQQGLQRRHQAGQNAVGRNSAIPHRGKGLRAEEEGAQKAAERRCWCPRPEGARRRSSRRSEQTPRWRRRIRQKSTPRKPATRR